MSKNTLPKLTPSEFEIMEVVWQQGEATVTEIMQMVNAAGNKQLKRSTIQVQVLRLEEKGWLTHHKEGRKFLFHATVSKEKVSADITRDVKERIFGGSCAELVKSLFYNNEVSISEIEKIRNLINEYEG